MSSLTIADVITYCENQVERLAKDESAALERASAAAKSLDSEAMNYALKASSAARLQSATYHDIMGRLKRGVLPGHTGSTPR